MRAPTMRAAHCRVRCRGRDERVGNFGAKEPKSKDWTICRVRNPQVCISWPINDHQVQLAQPCVQGLAKSAAISVIGVGVA